MKVKFWKMHCLDWKTRYDTGRTITSRILITKGLNHNSISKYLNHTDVRKCPRFSLRNLSLIPTLIVRIWFYIMMVERKIPSCFFCDKVALYVLSPYKIVPWQLQIANDVLWVHPKFKMFKFIRFQKKKKKVSGAVSAVKMPPH